MKFKEFQLKDLLDIQWGDTNTTKSSYVDEGYLAYSASGPDGFLDHFDYDADGVVLSAIGANCGTTFMAKGKWSCIKNTIRFLPKNNQIDIRYFYYLSKRSNFFPLRGSAQPFISQTDIRDLYVDIPDIKYQSFIGKTLDEIEQKIAVNNQISHTLESIAQSIFKSWFNDFDPVHAKSRGEKPFGMDDETASLFPDSFEESELGMIPKGWSWKTVRDIAYVIDCLHSKKPKLLANGFPYLQLDTISDNGVLNFENAGYISKEDYEKWTSRIEVMRGDCLITDVGRVGAVSQVPNHFKAAIGRNITAIRPINRELHQSFLIIALLSDFMKQEISRNTDPGTILEALNVKNIPKLVVPGIPDEITLRFARMIDPIQLKLQELKAMNVNLHKVRDSLLPRLISGELQIPEELLAS